MNNSEFISISQAKNLLLENEKRDFWILALLKSAQVKVAKNGSEFLIVEFADKSSAFTSMCFSNSYAFAVLKDADIGKAYKLHCSSDTYQGKVSIKIDSLEELSDDDFQENKERFIKTSKYDPQNMKEQLFEIIETIENPEIKLTVETALKSVGENFYTSTAAIKMHHAYMYGLLEHTLSCTKLALKLLDNYKFVNRDLSLAGTILHDIGKVEEYSQGLVSDKTMLGQLQGHVVLGYRIVRKAGIKAGLKTSLLERLEHIILSHQGELEWGAAIKAATPEAVFVSLIDNFDARMAAVENALDEAGNADFVEVPALKSRILTLKVEDDD